MPHGLRATVVQCPSRAPPPLAAEMSAASISMCLTSILFNPLDVVKVRLQAQHERPGSYRQYHGFVHTLRLVSAQEGLAGLWLPGLVASSMRNVINGAIRLGLYPTLRRAVASDDQGDIGVAKKLLIGLTTGAIGAFVGNPTDLVKIRFQGEAGRLSAEGIYTTGLYAGSRPSYPHTLAAFVGVYREAGLAGWLTGVGPSMLRASLVTAGQVAAYDHSKYLLGEKYRLLEEGPGLFFVASFVSGLCATTLSAPADLVKTRVMNDRAMAQVGQAARTGLSFRSATDCVVLTVQQEGMRALFKGWLPSWLRLGPHFMISWPLMEFVRKHLFGLDYF